MASYTWFGCQSASAIFGLALTKNLGYISAPQFNQNMPKRGRTPSTTRSSTRRKKRSRRYPIRKPLALKPHNFVERCTPMVLEVANESTASGLFHFFTLSQCLQVAHYKELFEYYRINKVVLEFRYKGAQTPAYTSTPATSSGNQAAYNQEIVNEINPVLYFKVDHNDNTSQTLNVLKESMRTREHQFTNSKPNFSITLKPAILMEAYKTSISTSYQPAWGKWLSTRDDTVPHYGIKAFAVAGMGNNPNMGKIEIQQKIYFSVKCNE